MDDPRRSGASRRAHIGRVAVALTLFVLAGWPGAARTQDAASAPDGDAALRASLGGTWVLAVSEARARELLDAGIAAAIEGMPPLVDSMAARQLRARTLISPEITLSLDPARIEARFAHATYASSPGATARVPVPGDASARMEMIQLLRDGHLEQIFTTAEGRRWNTFTPSGDGARLTLDAVVRSDRLPRDLRYRLPYRRR